MNVATHPRAPGRGGSLNPFDLGIEKRITVRKAVPPAERDVRPLDVGCVDWYLYPVDRKTRASER